MRYGQLNVTAAVRIWKVDAILTSFDTVDAVVVTPPDVI